MRGPRCALVVAVALAWLLVPSHARAFCGFYVSGADAKLFNNATVVVLMREGTRTVLSMQNDYQGPPEGFAVVVPVPEVLKQDNVKTLPREIFKHVDQLAAPRLVEYWEQDPCAPPPEVFYGAKSGKVVIEARGSMPLGVKVEAQFVVGEYQVVILSARDSTGLDTWLRKNHYNIPSGAEPLLRPYVQGGSKFFVAKVDPAKVKYEDGRVQLSPLRFHYDSKEFSLPVRLGQLNSAGTQDLLVHIVARSQRYEVANYPNVTIPTNLDLATAAKDQFGPFYVALFDAVLRKHPGAVVTEYAWDAGTCDPCPTPALAPDEIATLGADVLYPAPTASKTNPKPPPGPASPTPRPGAPGSPLQPPFAPPPPWMGQRFVLTRLHIRYAKDSLGQDLVFRAASPIAGGREFMQSDGRLERGAQPSPNNNFQARYAIRHPWTGPIQCPNPRRGMWGGPSGAARPIGAQAAVGLAYVPREQAKLADLLTENLDDLGVVATPAAAPTSTAPVQAPKPLPASPPAPTPPKTERPPSSCGSCVVVADSRSAIGFGAALAAALAGALRARRRKGRRAA